MTMITLVALAVFCVAVTVLILRPHKSSRNEFANAFKKWSPPPMQPFRLSTADDLADAINALVNVAHTDSTERGWWKAHRTSETYATKIALIHSEISEALEGYRKGKMDDHIPNRPSIEVELADALIRIFDLAGALKLDLGGAWKDKRNYNLVREDHNKTAREAEGGKKF